MGEEETPSLNNHEGRFNPAKGLSELMKDGFLTCVSEPGRPYVKINFPTLNQAQALHRALMMLKEMKS